MKVFKNIRPWVVVVALATSFVFSPLGFAGSASNLTGEDLGQNRALLDSMMHGRNYVVEVDRLGKIKQVVDAGAIGSGKDAQPPVVSAFATAKTSPAVGVSSVGLPVSYQGQDAIDYIGADLPKIAESHGLTQDKLKELLLTDSTVHIDKTKHIFYVDESLEQQLSANPSAAGAIANGAMANSPALPIGLTPTTANAFSLHSKPRASKTIYLDFDGYGRLIPPGRDQQQLMLRLTTWMAILIYSTTTS